LLRNYATEGAEAHDGAVAELAVFIAHGATAWLRPRQQSRSQGWERTNQGECQDVLAILLANMIESRGEP